MSNVNHKTFTGIEGGPLISLVYIVFGIPVNSRDFD